MMSDHNLATKYALFSCRFEIDTNERRVGRSPEQKDKSLEEVKPGIRIAVDCRDGSLVDLDLGARCVSAGLYGPWAVSGRYGMDT